jgi:hypothetical protein
VGNDEKGDPGSPETLTKAAKRPGDRKMAVAIILVTMVIVASILIIFNPDGPLATKATSPVQDGNYIVWSINGDVNGRNVSGVSVWTFSNVSGHAQVPGKENWPKYDILVRTIIDGNTSTFQTAGAYLDKAVWGLGVNPAGIIEGTLEGSSGYYNGGTPNFMTNETISTILGDIEASAYAQQYQIGSSVLWIDGGGLPIKMKWTGSGGVGTLDNPYADTMTFDILATNIRA